MEIAFLQFSVLILTCFWWINPDYSISWPRQFRIPAFHMLAFASLIFITCYAFVSTKMKSEPGFGFYSIGSLILSTLSFFLIPYGYVYLRNRFLGMRLNSKAWVHLLPGLIFLLGITFFYLASGQHILLIKKNANSPVYTIYGFTITAVYIVMIVRYLVSIPLKSGNSGKAIPKAEEKETTVFHVPGLTTANIHIGSVVLSGMQVEKIHHAVKHSLETRKSFLQQGYNLKQLSEDTSIPLHHLSAFINQFYNTHFNHLINEYRVRYCEGKIRNGEWKSKTLEAIARESGFNNRNTFTSSFKKVTGCNPSGFLQTVKQHQIA